MIGRLSGIVLEKRPDRAVVDASGVGYELHIPLGTFAALPGIGERASLHVHTHVREDAILLFGFATAEEKALFERLITVSGIGPKLALVVLSGLPLPELVGAIAAQNVARLSTIPGVGKKLAERLGVELKDKVSGILSSSSSTAFGVPAALGGFLDDAVGALVNLGYRKPQAEAAVKAASDGPPRRTSRRSSLRRCGSCRGEAEGATMDERLLAGDPEPEEREPERTLRPTALGEFVGQTKLKETLGVFLTAARRRREPLDHVLLFGPPGLGKTTLAHIIAREMGAQVRVTAGPVLEKAGDLAAILTNLGPGDVLFIDEIHRIPAGRRGDPLPRARGREARPRHRHRTRRADGGAAPAAVHARRRDDARGASLDAAHRAIRHHAPPRLLRHGRR